MKKHADWPCRSPGRGRLSADERLQVGCCYSVVRAYPDG